MPELHLAYQDSPRLVELLRQWDAQTAAEPPLTRRPWTNVALWPAARSATVAGSTGIEGNPLTAAEVDRVLTGGRVEARPTDIREVHNYNRALDLANAAALREDFEWSQELLRRLNAAVMQGLEDDEHGEYRHGPVTVGRIYSPPPWQLLPSLMAELVDWLRDEERCHPLIRAGLTHLNVVSIHPWLNGNGRAARVAGSLMLMRCGVGSPELLNIESVIRGDRERYARVLQTTHGATYDPEHHAATEWLEYFAELCVGRLEFQARLLDALQGDSGLLAMEFPRELSTQQIMVLIAASVRLIQTTDLAGALDLSAPRMRALLSSLASDGWLTAEGDGRGRRYRPGPRLVELPLRTPELMNRFRRGEPAPDGSGT
jgi:hypothetical protein